MSFDIYTNGKLVSILEGIVAHMTIEEELRFLKIINEMIKLNDISLKFVSRLFMAIREMQINNAAPKVLIELEDELCDCDTNVEWQRTAPKEISKKIERAISVTIRKLKQERKREKSRKSKFKEEIIIYDKKFFDELDSLGLVEPSDE